MKEYHKIETLLDRDEKFKVIEGKWRLPEFEYLKDCQWEFTEKVDGTNIRIMWENGKLTFGGKTDNAQMPTFLMGRLQSLFSEAKFAEVFPDGIACLFGEGYGAKIQKGGGNYNPAGCDFVLFDVKVGEWWLARKDVADVASKFGITVVPTIGIGTLSEAINKTKVGFNSQWGNFQAEGIVVRPTVELFMRSGQRLIGKIKAKDFGG